MRLFSNARYNIVGLRKFFGTFSFTLCLVIIIAVSIVGIDWGIDFVGGEEVQFQFAKNVEVNQIRKAITDAPEFSAAEIKSYGGDNQFIVRVKQIRGKNGATAEKTSVKLQQILDNAFPGNHATKLGENSIGPKVGSEMRTSAILAVVLALIVMLIYIGFRFEFAYGLGASIALVHDVIISVGLTVLVGKTSLLNLEFTQTVLAAALTVVGYSVNDTVVIFDRIRENKDKMKGIPFEQIANISINETLSRTIMTSFTTFIVLFVMVLGAGPVLQGFAFLMAVGVIVGTYSSIYIASSFVIWYNGKFGKNKEKEALKTAAAKAE